MLDQNLLDELRKVFSVLESKIDLVHDDSDHADQKDLLTLLEQIASTNYKVSVVSSGKKSAIPRFVIKKNGAFTGSTVDTPKYFQ